MINYNLRIDCQGDKVLSSDIVFVSGDVKAYKLIFEFKDGGNDIDIKDCILTVRARRADGSCVEGAGEIVDGKGVYIPQNSIYAIPGEVRMEVALCNSAKSYVTTKIIVAEVLEGIGNSCKPEETEVSVFVSLLNQLQTRMDAVRKLAEDGIPVKGEDYWTDHDKAEIVDEINREFGKDDAPFIIKFELLENGVGESDKTCAEVAEAINANRSILVQMLPHQKYCLSCIYQEVHINELDDSDVGVTLGVFDPDSREIKYFDCNSFVNVWNCYVLHTIDSDVIIDEKINDKVGDIEAALDGIVALQENYIGGAE